MKNISRRTFFARLGATAVALYVSLPALPGLLFSPSGKTIFVNSVTGDDAQDGLTPGTAVATLQAGLDSAGSGGTVHIAAGHYEILEPIPFNRTLIGEGPRSVIRLG